MLTTERKHLGILVSFANILEDRYLEDFDFTREDPTSEKIRVVLTISSSLETGALVDEFSKYDPIYRAPIYTPSVFFGRSKLGSSLSETLSEDIIFQIPLEDFQEVKEKILSLPGYKILRRVSGRNYVLG